LVTQGSSNAQDAFVDLRGCSVIFGHGHRAACRYCCRANVFRSHPKALLQPEKTCTLTGFTFGTIAPYNLDDLSVVILVYSVEGCGGGNNWHSAIAAFDIKQSGKSISDIRLHKFSPDIERALIVAGINSINFLKTDIGAQSVTIDTLDWGADDAHCCPRDGRQLKFWVDKGVLKAAVTKRWREPQR
jgi:hypothetical protein